MLLPEIHDLFVFLPIVPFSFGAFSRSFLTFSSCFKGSMSYQESQLRKRDKT